MVDCTIPALLQMAVSSSFLFRAMFTLPRKERNIRFILLLKFNVCISHRGIFGGEARGKAKSKMD